MDDSFDLVYHSHFLEHLTPDQAAFIIKECFRVLKPGGVLRIVVPDLEYNARLYLDALAEATSGSRPPDPLVASRYQWALLNLIDQMVRYQTGGMMISYLSQPQIDEEFLLVSTGGTELKSLRERLLAFNYVSVVPEPVKHSSQNWLSKLCGLISRKIPAKPLEWIKHRVIRLLFGDLLLKQWLINSSGELHKWMYDRYSISILLTDSGFTQVRFFEPGKSYINSWGEIGLDLEPDGLVYKPNSLYAEGIKPGQLR